MDKEYGVELDVDLSSFNAKLDEAVSRVKKASNDIEKTTRTIKVTSDDNAEKIKIDTTPIKRLNSELQDTLDFKKRLETGKLKIFDNSGFNEDFAKADEEYNKIRLSQTGFINWNKIKEEQQANTELGQSLNAVSQEFEEASTSGNQFLVTIERLISRRLGRRTFLGTEFFNKTFFSDMKDGTTTLQSFSTSLLKLGGATLGIYGIKKLFDLAINSIKKAKEETERYKKIVLGVFTSIINGAKQLLSSAVGYMQNFFNKALNSYMSFDQQLTKNIQNVWAGLGSYLAPILEYIVSLFQRLLAYINATIKVLTGVDFIARANAKAMNGVASATAKATKALAGFDELQNIERESGGGGGISGGTIEIPDVDVSNVESFAKKIKEMIDQDNWEGVGFAVRDKIIDSLNKIPWAEIQAKAGEIGRKLAEFLNGLFTPNVDGTTLGASLGRTLANAINTGLNFLDSFLTTINWDLVAQNIIDFIVESIENIDWNKALSVAQKIANGILTILKTALNKLNEKLPELLDAFDKFLHSAEGQQFLDTIAQIITTWKELKDKVSSIFDAVIDEVKGILMDKLGKTPWIVKFSSAFSKIFSGGIGTIFSDADTEVKKGSSKVKTSFENNLFDIFNTASSDTEAGVKKVSNTTKTSIEETGAEISELNYATSYDIWESYNDGGDDVDNVTPVKLKMSNISSTIDEEGVVVSKMSYSTSEDNWKSYNDGADSVDTTTPARDKIEDVLEAMNEELDISGGKSKKTEKMGDILGSSLNSGYIKSDAIKEAEDYFSKVFNAIDTTTIKAQKETTKGGKGLGSTLGEGIGNGFNSVINNSLKMVKDGLNNVIGLFNKSAENIGNNYSVKLKGSVANGVNSAFNVAQDVFSNITARIQRVPYLSIGTNEVYSEGLAYLHTGEKVVPANVAKGGYDSSDNKETNMLLRVLIDTLENKEFRASIGKDDVGKASVDYINKMKRITGGAIV